MGRERGRHWPRPPWLMEFLIWFAILAVALLIGGALVVLLTLEPR